MPYFPKYKGSLSKLVSSRSWTGRCDQHRYVFLTPFSKKPTREIFDYLYGLFLRRSSAFTFDKTWISHNFRKKPKIKIELKIPPQYFLAWLSDNIIGQHSKFALHSLKFSCPNTKENIFSAFFQFKEIITQNELKEWCIDRPSEGLCYFNNRARIKLEFQRTKTWFLKTTKH